MTERVEERLTFTKLSGTVDYRRWAAVVKVVLIDKDVWDIVSRVRRRPTAVAEQLKWDKANNKALKVLFTSVSDEQLAYVIEEDLAENVWNRLKTLHG